MAISFKSQTFHSSPYVLPLDLGLFSNIMSVKQKKFDDNSAKFQGEIDQMGLLDVVKAEDKDYLNKKIQDVVSSVNNLGGVDYSDQSIFNQIEGLGSNVYGDKKVINAIASTKQIRNLNASYEKYKTDPKLSKLYSAVNESFDNQAVAKYMDEQGPGSVYEGPSSATPYSPYRDNLIKAMDKVKADYRKVITDKGYYYVNEKSEIIEPQRIADIAAGLLNPEEQAQMSRDGWYKFRGLSPEDLVNKASIQFSYKKQDAVSTLEQYKIMANAAVSDPEAKARYNYLVTQQQKVVDQYTAAERAVGASTLTKYKENPNQLYGELYTDDFLRGMGNLYSQNKVDYTITPNTAAMWAETLRHTDARFMEALQQKNAELAATMTNNAEKNAIELAKAGLIRVVDPQTGAVDYIDKPGWKDGKKVGTTDASGHLITDTPNIEDPKKIKTSESKLNESINQTKLNNNQLYQGFLTSIVGQHPELGDVAVSSTDKGWDRILKGQDVISTFNGEEGFQMDDLKAFEKDDKGNFVNADKINYFNRIYNLSPKSLEFLANQWKNYEAITLGKGTLNSDLADGFETTARSIQLNNENINSTKELIKRTKESVATGMKLSPKVLKAFDEEPALINPTYSSGRENKDDNLLANAQRWFLNLGSGDPAVTELKKEFNRKVNEKLAIIETRDVYGVRTLGATEKPELSAFVMQNIVDNKGEPYGDSGTIPNTKSVNTKDVDPVMIGRTSDGTGRTFVISEIKKGVGDKEITFRYKTYLDDKTAEQFGIFRDPYEAINRSVDVNGRTGDIFIYGSKTLASTINIVGDSNKLNQNNAYAQIKIYNVDGNGQKTKDFITVTIPNTQGRTASESFKFAETAIKEAAKYVKPDGTKLTTQEFQEYIINYKTTNPPQ